MKISEGRQDGMLDLDGELPEVFGSVQDAVESGKEQALAGEGQSWIYECRPVRRIGYKPIVERLVRITTNPK